MKDAYYFKHDSNARNDPKCQALIEKYGIEGYGRFWILIEMIRETSHYRLEDKPYVIRSLANQFKVKPEEVRTFLKDCIEEFNLLCKDNGYIYSQSLLKRMILLDEIRDKRVYAGKQRHIQQT